MIGDICLTMDMHLKPLYEKIQSTYPTECQRCGFDEKRFLGAVESYIKANNKPVDFVPEMKALLNHLEKMLNMEGKSFFNEVPTIEYTPTGKTRQTYRIWGTKIFNKNDQEVFATDSKDRRKIFANFAVQQGRAVVVTYKAKKYVVDNKNQIISVTSGDIMQWGEENGDRKEILRLSQIAFREKQKAETPTVNSNGVLDGKVKTHQGNWSRQEAQNNPRVLYVFTDNTDRDSGNGLIPDNSWYAKKYGKGHHFPTMTAAVIRGLDNARPISTQRWYHTGAKGETGRWTDADVTAFKAVIRDELQEIVNEFNTGKYDTIMFPDGDGLFNTKISNISKERTPQLYQALAEMLHEFGFDSLIPADITINQEENRSIIYEGVAVSSTLGTAIKTGKWTKETIDEFNNLVKQIQNEKVDIKRGVGERRSFSSGRSEVHEGASLILGTEIGTSEKKRGNPQAEYEVDAAEGREQEKLLEAWAKAADLWLNDYEDAEGNKANTLEDLLHSQWQYLNIGSEAEVYEYDDTTVLKSINLSHANDNPGKLLDRIAMFNVLFPGTAMEVVGFGRDSQGHFRVIVTQPHIEGTELTEEDLEEFHKKYNLERVGGWFKTKIPNVYVTDLSPSNILKDKDGRYYIIDADVKYDSEAATINPALEKFKMEVDMLTGYYEGGGTTLKDVYPNLPEKLDAKLADYFLGDGKLTIEDYRELYKIIHPSIAPSPSNASSETSNLAAGSITFGAAPTAQQMAEAQARYEERNKPQPEKPIEKQPKSVAYESALKPKKNRNTDFRNTFTPQQIQDRGAMISNEFSDILDEIIADEIDAQLEIVAKQGSTEAEKESARELINNLKDPVNGRQLMAQKQGVDWFLKTIKERLKANADAADENTKVLWDNTLEYFNELFYTQATLDIEEREGIRIVGDFIANKTVAEEEAEDNEGGDPETGNTATGSDGWNYKVRYENPFDTMSKKVRSMCYDIEMPSSQVDDLGQTKKYPMGRIYASLLSYCSKYMQNPDDFMRVYTSKEDLPENLSATMYETGAGFNSDYPNGFPVFPVLEKMKDMYPWVTQIIQRLTDDYLNPELNSNLRYPSTGGTMASQFYTVFRKPFIPYGKVQLGGTVEDITPLNYQMEDRVQLDKLSANYNNRLVLTDTSIYDSLGKISKKNAQLLKNQISDALQSMKRNDYGYLSSIVGSNKAKEVEKKEYDAFLDKAKNILNSFGIDATQGSVATYLVMEEDGAKLSDMLKDLEYITDVILKLDDEKIETTNYMLDLRNPYGENVWKTFFNGRGLITDASYMQSFYDSASHKTKYSYSADNYLMKTFRGLAMGSKEARRAYIMEHFGKYDWYRNQKTGEWRNEWLKYWYDYEDDIQEIPYRNIDNISEKQTDNTFVVRPYMKWTQDDIWQVQNRSYGGESKRNTGYFLAPIFSDSPMSMTVRGPKLDINHLLYGYDENGKHHYGALVQTVFQELSRIKLVQQRADLIKEGTIKPIANFDGKRGLSFCFFPELNRFTFEDGESFLDKMISLKTSRELESAAVEALQSIIDKKAEAFVRENDAHYQGFDWDAFREQYYNMTYGNIAIIQLTTVDLAFYKDEIDFQKRFKEVYAGGLQLNTNSKYGEKTENVVLLKDDIITSPSYSSIAAIIDGNPNITAKEKEDIKDIFRKVNVADAQAIRSMHSFRSVLDMMGRWDDRMEEAMKHFEEGTWRKEDFDVIYQTIKPFAYAVIERNAGNGNKILVPQQHKNSEICALMMYNLINNALDNSPVYKALSRFMENTVGADGKPLIHMIQYESAGKVGNQGALNISFNPNKVISVIENGVVADGKEIELYTDEINNNDFLPNDIEHASQNYEAIKFQLDKKLQNGDISQEGYNKIMSYLRPTEEEIISMLEEYCLVKNPDGTRNINEEVVHTIPFDNYYQQQPTPEHHVDAEATYGSQARNLTPADMPADFELTLEGRNEGKKASKTFKGSKEIIDFMYELLNENLIEDFFGVTNSKGEKIKDGLKDVFSSKKKFKEAIEELVRTNPKYGRDFIEAMQLDENGDFTLSPNSPTMFNLMQELVTSLFKNRITRQKINGAALIQAAGIGLDDNLRILTENGRVIGAECYMPLTSKRFFEPLLEERIINGEKVMYLDPKKLKKAGLDKAIGYRIPTENKSSMMPLIIKGFTPLQNGSAIILPAEITAISGSDFDVDKMYLMLSSFKIRNYDMRAARKAYEAEQNINAAIWSKFSNSQLAEEILDEDPLEFHKWFNENKDRFLLEKPEIVKIEYDFSKSPKENGRKARNNMLIQMTFNILTSKYGSESLLNPQGFPDVQKAAKVNRLITSPSLIAHWIEMYETREDALNALLDTDAETLSKFIKDNSPAESPIYPQTFTHSHARNMAGAIQIGIYAIQSSMSAKYQRANVRLKEEYQYSINGKKIVDVDKSDNGRRVKNVGQLVGASADNGKDPNLTDMGSTDKTAPIIGYLLRCGLSHLEATLLINQPTMKIAGYKSTNYGVFPPDIMRRKIENVDTKLLMRAIIDPGSLSPSENTSITGICYRILKQAEAMEYITQVSRADSPNGSLGNSYAKGRIQQYKVDLLQAMMTNDFPFYKINETLSNDAIDITASEDVVREQLKQQPMAFLHGMYALGINSFRHLISPYFFGAQEWFDTDIVKPILYNLNEKLPDANKVDIVNKIYNSYITFILSDSELFGNEPNETMAHKRKRYIESFPREYQKILQENPTVRELFGSILQIKQFGDKMRIVLQDIGSISKGQKQEIKLRFENLSFSEQEAMSDLAKKFLIYSYFDNGLQFTHDSFSSMLTTSFLSNFPMFNETLKKLDEKISPQEEQRFKEQFIVTFSQAALPADKIIANAKDAVTITGDSITFDFNIDRVGKNAMKKLTNEVMSPNKKLNGFNLYPYITYNYEVYALEDDFMPNAPTYYKLPKYATYPTRPLFNKTMSLYELAQEFPYNETESKQEVAQEDVIAHEDTTEYNMDVSDWEDPDMDEDITPLPESKGEQYTNEGKGEIQDPFCLI